MVTKAKTEETVAEVRTHKNVFEALSAAQNDIGPVFKNADNPHFRSAFVDLAGLIDAAQPALYKNGLTLFHTTRYPQDEFEELTVEAHIVHGPSETKIVSEYPLRTDKPNNPQKLGAALTYARRYTAMAILGVAAEDDDGNYAAGLTTSAPAKTAAPRKPAATGSKPTASATKPASEKQIGLVESLLKQNGYTTSKAQDEFTTALIGKTLDDALTSKNASDLITALKEEGSKAAPVDLTPPF